MNEISEKIQTWNKPELEEIPLSCEITTYSNAELPSDLPGNPII